MVINEVETDVCHTHNRHRDTRHDLIATTTLRHQDLAAVADHRCRHHRHHTEVDHVTEEVVINFIITGVVAVVVDRLHSIPEVALLILHTVEDLDPLITTIIIIISQLDNIITLEVAVVETTVHQETILINDQAEHRLRHQQSPHRTAEVVMVAGDTAVDDGATRDRLTITGTNDLHHTHFYPTK